MRRAAALVTLTLAACGESGPATVPEGFDLADPRLTLSLYAETPEIVTPIGLAIDARDRLYVLESHTHSPPSDYAGPEGDRIVVFEDADGDGRPEGRAVFAAGLEDGMNLALSADGILYLVAARGVWALPDADADGTCDGPERVLELVEPDSVYDHAALLGLAFSSDGWMYVSRGNTGSAGWRLVGSDGSSVAGYGDGGNVMRARPDGTALEEVATGFWNPFGLEIDARGRLLAVDNDPDSRGPNRLVHVVPDGHYGYESLYGGSGIHPYLAWNGELPDTLPFTAALGEAPSGVIDASRAALPPDYAGDLLVGIWEESRIARVRLRPRGTSLAGTEETVLQGRPDFRPVAFAADSAGTLYFTDWVIREYPNHGHGRLWRLATRPGEDALTPRPDFPVSTPDEGSRRLSALRESDDFDALREGLLSGDPFVRHAAVVALGRPAFEARLLAATTEADAAVRLGALLALRRAPLGSPEPLLRRLLSDPDARIRTATLEWIGQETLTTLAPALPRVLEGLRVTPALFEAWLATTRHLTPEFVEAYRSRSEAHANRLPRRLPEGFLARFAAGPAHPVPLRALALARIDEPEQHVELLLALLDGEEPRLRLEAVRSLATVADPAVAERLLAVARDSGKPTVLRAEALLALGHQPADLRPAALELLRADDDALRIETVRYLRTRPLDDAARAAVAALEIDTGAEPHGLALAEQRALALGTAPPRPRPATPAGWQEALAAGGDPERGARVFHSVQGRCSECHAVGHRGGDLGPALDNVARSKSRAQLVRALIEPSAEISPEWQGWYVETDDGRIHAGRQIDVHLDDIELYLPRDGFVTFDEARIVDYGVSRVSLMPDELEAELTRSDLADVVAFLESLE